MAEEGAAYLLEKYVIPELREIRTMLGQKADAVALREVRQEIAALEEKFEQFESTAMNKERVSTIIGEALQDRRARGWTTWEHWRVVLITIGAVLVTVLTTLQFFFPPPHR